MNPRTGVARGCDALVAATSVSGINPSRQVPQRPVLECGDLSFALPTSFSFLHWCIESVVNCESAACVGGASVPHADKAMKKATLLAPTQRAQPNGASVRLGNQGQGDWAREELAHA